MSLSYYINAAVSVECGFKVYRKMRFRQKREWRKGWRNEKRKPLQGEMFQFNHAENCIFLPLKLKLKYPLVGLFLDLIHSDTFSLISVRKVEKRQNDFCPHEKSLWGLLLTI